MRKDEAAVRRKVRELENELDAGTIRKTGARNWTARKWLENWLEDIAPLTTRYKALRAYRTAVHKHLIPGPGAHKLDRIQHHPEYFERLCIRMIESGLKPGTAHQVHRTTRTAFGEAQKRGLIGRNPVEIAEAPRLEEDEIAPWDAEEVRLTQGSLGAEERGAVRRAPGLSELGRANRSR